ncbi:type VII secretion target [Glycomyces buryatensis]|uniref:ESX-1 secretion-associated protein n=1 Tax=Glycomyces buryatensis TaxID=2570927 RepID=A0A4S8QAL3_9ACTN|nr:type VII secretion target [Glycomyces buryatensis]THV41543.1 hypothetical protein FAB82_10565 [Glycomyces buryatensis]
MVDVDPQSLRDHASRLVNGPMTRVATAADAAQQVRLGDEEAYGIIFAQVIPPILELFLDDAGAAIGSAAELGVGFAAAVDDTANQYTAADDEVEAIFNDLLAELDGATS